MVVAGRGQGGLNKKSTLVQNMSFLVVSITAVSIIHQNVSPTYV